MRRGKPNEKTDRWPPPWRVVEHPANFTVQDATGQNVAWFLFRNDPGITQSAAVLFKEEARRRAMEFARLRSLGVGLREVPQRADQAQELPAAARPLIRTGAITMTMVWIGIGIFASSAEAFWLMAPRAAKVSPNTVMRFDQSATELATSHPKPVDRHVVAQFDRYSCQG